MSFADELRQNYTPKSTDRYTERIQALVENIVYTVRECAASVSRTQRQLKGYYYYEYDGNIIGPEQSKSRFVYDTDFGPHRKGIEAYYGKIIHQNTYSRRDAQLIVQGVTEKLKAEGFVNPIVRAEETVARYKYGHTEFLHREKYDEFPAFAIYVDIRW